MTKRPCPFCGVKTFPDGLTYGHAEGCFFDLQWRRGVSEAEYQAAWEHDPELSVENADGLDFHDVLLLLEDGVTLSRSAWDSFGVPTAANRIFMKGETLIYCTWDGVEDEFRPRQDDLFASDWKVVSK